MDERDEEIRKLKDHVEKLLHWLPQEVEIDGVVHTHIPPWWTAQAAARARTQVAEAIR